MVNIIKYNNILPISYLASYVANTLSSHKSESTTDISTTSQFTATYHKRTRFMKVDFVFALLELSQ